MKIKEEEEMGGKENHGKKQKAGSRERSDRPRKVKELPQVQQGVPQTFPEADLQASKPVILWGLHSLGPASPSLLGPREY